MTLFLRSLIGVVKSNIIKSAQTAVVDAAVGAFDIDLGDIGAGLLGEKSAGFVDVIQAAGMDAVEGGDSSVLAALNAAADEVAGTNSNRITSTPRGIRQLAGIVVNRVGEVMPTKQQFATAAIRSIPGVTQIEQVVNAGRTVKDKLYPILKSGKLGLAGYRVKIAKDNEGVERIVGKASNYRLLMSYLSEFSNPRKTPVDKKAYFRSPMTKQNVIIAQPGLPRKIAEMALTRTFPAIKILSQMRDKFLKLASTAPERLRKADRAKFIAAISEYDKGAKDRMKMLGEDLASQRITYKQFRRGMEAEIRRTVLAETILSIGGVGNITDEVLVNVKQRIQTDLKALDEFIGELKSRGSKEDDLFGTAKAKGGDDLPNVPDTDAVPLQTVDSALAGINVARLSDSNVTDDSYAETGTITGEDLQTISKSTQAFETAQINFSELAVQNQDEYQLMEVRRLEEGVHNCDFCISWADKPMPPGQLPAIGDSGCDGVRYDTGGCHCVMDVASDEEIQAMGGDE